MKKLTLFLSAMLLACATNLRAEGENTSLDTLFHETFGNNSSSARDWEDSYSVKSGVAAVYQNATYIITNAKQGKNSTGQTKSGLNQSSQGTDAEFIVGPLSVAGYQNLKVTYYWKAASIKGKYTTNLYYSTDDGKNYTEVTRTSGTGATTFVQCVYFLPEAAQSNNLYLKVVFNTSNTQAVIDEFVLMGESASTATLQSIEITGEPTKKDYMAGDEFSTDGLKVMGNYENNNTPVEITSGITWKVTPATLTAGMTSVEVTATVGEKTATRTIEGLTVTVPKTLTSIAVSGTPAEFWKGDPFNHNGMTVIATWDDASTTDVTTEATFSTPDMTTAGTQTITVTYKEKTATYNITVKTIANTQETAYTVAEAIALIDAGKDLTTKVFVKGTISKIDDYNSKYNSITYWLDDNSFEVYSGKGLNNTNFNSKDDIALGGEVIVYGIIKKYSGTYEFDKNNYLVYYKAPAGEKEVATITLNGNKTEMEITEEDNEYTVTYNGDGELSITSSNEAVAVAIIEGTDIVVDVLSIGTTTITISAPETDKYLAAEAKYTLTVVPAWVAASLPFTFDGGKSSIAPENGIKQSGLGSDYDSSPKLKFGETGASLIIWFNETAASVSYSIKGNPSSGIWSGTFDVLESEDNQNYRAVESYTDLTQKTLTETKTLSSSTRYIKFVYSNKVFGNVALGAIKIAKPSTPSAINNAVIETPAIKAIENGQLVILRDGVKYNAMGVRLQ